MEDMEATPQDTFTLLEKRTDFRKESAAGGRSPVLGNSWCGNAEGDPQAFPPACTGLNLQENVSLGDDCWTDVPELGGSGDQ